jgi:F-type H+-transporting ATPase subunit gamma
MTAERGLCGGFNSNIAKLARNHAAKLKEDGKQLKIITVGKKGRDAIKRELGEYFIEHVDLSEFKSLKYTNAQSIAKLLLARFDDNEYDVATIFYSKFVNVVTQIPTAQQIIPATFDDHSSTSDSTVYDYEPDEETILADLLPRGVATQVFSALLENGASEQGARMSAMDNATRNAGDMIDKLTIEFNRSRQAVITNELIEIISGAEAL